MSEKLKDTLNNANKYVADNRLKVGIKPTFHLTGEIGWINDPNGFSFYKNKYHLFYQHNPYDVQFGDIYWGHATSDDMVSWKYEDIALAPDKEYDINGCFSGTAIVDNEKLVIMYTGFCNPDKDDISKSTQVQCIAVGDGKYFEKFENNPVIDKSNLPENCSEIDFRDPKIWVNDGVYYSLIANRASDGLGQLLLYKSTNLSEWEFVCVLLKNNGDFGKMWECPDLFMIEDKYVLIISPQEVVAKGDMFQNEHGTMYFIGDFNYDTFEFTYSDFNEIDFGLEFYAPQTLKTDDGRTILVAWCQSWGETIHHKVNGYSGIMTIPRELTIKNNKLYQYPVRELNDYRSNEVIYTNAIINGTEKLENVNGNIFDMELNIKNVDASFFEVRFLEDGESYVNIKVDFELNTVTFSRENNKFKGKNNTRTIHLKNTESIKMRILLDLYTFELFINDGEYATSYSVYAEDTAKDITFISDDKVKCDVSKWDISKR